MQNKLNIQLGHKERICFILFLVSTLSLNAQTGTDTDGDGIPDCTEKNLTGDVGDAFNLNGDANQMNSDEVQLTEDTGDQSGQMWSYGKVDFTSSFTLSYEANLGDADGGADGIATVFQNDPNGINAAGAEGIGIGASGIQNGIVLELDTFQNSSAGDPAEDHGHIWASANNEDAANWLSDTESLSNLEVDDTWHDVEITWDESTQTLSYTVGGNNAGSHQFTDIINDYFDGASTVYFGYTASTGGSTNDQRVRFSDLCTLPLSVDNDNDGTPDYLDLDSDNDGILDADEGTNDTDGDGIPNYLDLDSDNDGCPDALEGDGTYTSADLDSEGRFTTPIDADGIPNNGSSQEVGASQDASDSSTCCDPAISGLPDTDGDGIADECDLDSDNDGIFDILECGVRNPDVDFSASDGDTETFNAPAADYGFIFDVHSLDNSFNLEINGVDLATNEIQFQTGSTPDINIRFADGEEYGGSEASNIWEIDGDANNPIIRVIIHKNGSVNMYGIKNTGDSLEPLVLYNGNSFNTIIWNKTGSNTVVLSQSNVNPPTDITGNGRGIEKGFCDPDGDGVSNEFDLDSDNDGCYDAIEGAGEFTVGDLDYPSGDLTSQNPNKNFGTAVDSSGIPTSVGSAGQGIGNSQDAAIKDCTQLIITNQMLPSRAKK